MYFFQGYHKEFHERIKLKKAVYLLQISALVPEIFKYKISVKYANEMADHIKHLTQYYIRYINRAILGDERGLVVGHWTCNSEVAVSNPPPCH